MTRFLFHSALGLSLTFYLGCKPEELNSQTAQLLINVLPGDGQSALQDPVGMNVGPVPLRSAVVAQFELENVGIIDVKIKEVRVRDVERGEIRPNTLDKEGVITANQKLPFSVLVSAFEDNLAVSGTIDLVTDISNDLIIPIRIEGTGVFVGEPLFEICYSDSECYRVPQSCDMSNGRCDLPPNILGNIESSGSALTRVTLRNQVPEGSCLPPGNASACLPTCGITIDKNTDAEDLGVGFETGETGFSIAGNVALPFILSTRNESCPSENNIFREDVPISLRFNPPSETNASFSDTLIIETDEAGAETIAIPLTVNVQEGPEAVAKIKECGLPPNCTDPENIIPRQRIYFDGNESFDPREGTVPEAAVVYWDWRIIDEPGGANPQEYEFEGQGTPNFSFFAPLAGEYILRLTVRNEIGLQSSPSETSDVTVNAVPESRFHLQLVWDHPTNDQDLHLVNLADDDLVYSATADCFWRQCKPGCVDGSNPCTPVQWDSEFASFEGPNPRLDVDATDGLGPENINIDEPTDGKYAVYVHYYGLVNQNDDPTRAVLRIYLDGVLFRELSRDMERNDLWRAAEIEWSNEGEHSVTLSESDGNGIGSVKQLNYVPFPNGIDFGAVP